MGLWHSIALQFRQPSGIIGRIAGFLFRLNVEGIDWTIQQLDIQPTDHVLEVGFGPGHGIQRAAKLAAQGKVAGVDISDVMLEQATKRNAGAIAAGNVGLQLGDASHLPYPDNSFHKVFGTNVVYFWSDPVATLKEIKRVMKPGGRLALYVISKEDIANFKVTQTGIYHLYTGEELAGLLIQGGFHNARFVTQAERHRTGICALGEK
jgi:ubiquinone/menaquinone biosynthesis C-methylase UbiE